MMIDYSEYENETRKHQQLVNKYLTVFAMQLLDRGACHDDSKLAEPERSTFARVTKNLKGLTYGSPEYKAQLKELGPALEHHYMVNKHHPEYDTLNGYAFQTLNDPMLCKDLVDVVEMFCDWLAATKRHDDGCIGKSIEIQKKKLGLPEMLCQMMRNTVDQLEATRLAASMTARAKRESSQLSTEHSKGS